jgi:hypothetical protein
LPPDPFVSVRVYLSFPPPSCAQAQLRRIRLSTSAASSTRSAPISTG